VLTANLEVQVKCFNALKWSLCGNQTLAATGVGFTHEEALLACADHIRPRMESLTASFW
jgi:hypothetical protein